MLPSEKNAHSKVAITQKLRHFWYSKITTSQEVLMMFGFNNPQTGLRGLPYGKFYVLGTKLY